MKFPLVSPRNPLPWLLIAALGSSAPSWAQTHNPQDWEPGLRADLTAMATKLTNTLKPWPVPERTFKVEDYGALADGATVNSVSIQKTVDACAAAGGGTVLLSKGDYVSGTIVLKSGVMLKVDKGARLLASLQLTDYPDHVAAHETIMDSHYQLKTSLIYAENCERIGICGEGEINGRGSTKNFPGANSTGAMPGRPFLIRFVECKKVVMDGIHLTDSAGWLENYLACDDVILQGLKVQNQANSNNDGIDIDGCHNVIVRDCTVNSEDDGMCFKGASGRTMENVLVENSHFYSTCNALKFGTDSQGGFRNVLIRDIEVGGPSADMPSIMRRPTISGISLESVDGAEIENVLCTNIHMVRTSSPLFLRLGNRGRVVPGQPKKIGSIRRIIFDGITGKIDGQVGSIFTGIPGATIQDVVVRNVSLEIPGGGEIPGEMKEKIGDYPEAGMFGKQSPAYGFWMRHIANVSFFNVTVKVEKPDARPLYSVGLDAANVQVEGKVLEADAAKPVGQ